MTNQNYPSVNGYAPSWSDIGVTAGLLGGGLVDVKGIAGISTGRSLEIGEQYEGGILVALTVGKETSEASIDFYRTGFDQFMENLMSIAPVVGNQVKIGLARFDVLVQHTPPNSSRIYQRKLVGCRIAGDTMDSAEGTDAQQVNVPLKPMRIFDIINGKEVVLI